MSAKEQGTTGWHGSNEIEECGRRGGEQKFSIGYAFGTLPPFSCLSSPALDTERKKYSLEITYTAAWNNKEGKLKETD